MLGELTKKEIIDFIAEEAFRVKYGKLFIQLNVVDSEVIDIEVETKKRKYFNSNKPK